jgi:hypothetical protein
MTFNASSFLAGVGTVLATVVIGFGGGLIVTRVLTDDPPRDPGKVERRVSETAKSEGRPMAAAAPVPAPEAPQMPAAARIASPSNPVPTRQDQDAGPSEVALPPAPQSGPPSSISEPGQNPQSLGPQRPASLAQSSRRTAGVPASTKRSISHDDRRRADREGRSSEHSTRRVGFGLTRTESEQRRTERRRASQGHQTTRAQTEDRVVQPYEKGERPPALQRQHAIDRPSPDSPYGD